MGGSGKRRKLMPGGCFDRTGEIGDARKVGRVIASIFGRDVWSINAF